MKRATFKVTRPCGHCKGTGFGKCVYWCHACEGKAERTFQLYASDLETATLTTFVAPPIDASDPSMRVAPRGIIGQVRKFMTAAEAHAAAAEMMMHGEITGYTVTGWDEYASLSPENQALYHQEIDRLHEQKVSAYVSSETNPWQDEAEALVSLERIGMVEKDPIQGTLRLTGKGQHRLNQALIDCEDITVGWVQQCVKIAASQAQGRATGPRVIVDADDIAQEKALRALEKAQKNASAVVL